jgi:hypothetical protein
MGFYKMKEVNYAWCSYGCKSSYLGVFYISSDTYLLGVALRWQGLELFNGNITHLVYTLGSSCGFALPWVAAKEATSGQA